MGGTKKRKQPEAADSETEVDPSSSDSEEDAGKQKPKWGMVWNEENTQWEMFTDLQTPNSGELPCRFVVPKLGKFTESNKDHKEMQRIFERMLKSGRRKLGARSRPAHRSGKPGYLARQPLLGGVGKRITTHPPKLPKKKKSTEESKTAEAANDNTSKE